jgi:hypothetical protein
MGSVKEKVFAPIGEYFNSLPSEVLESKDFSVLCLISDESGVGEVMIGSGEALVSSIAHALLDNDDLMSIMELAISVVNKHKEQQSSYDKLAQFADKKYKS